MSPVSEQSPHARPAFTEWAFHHRGLLAAVIIAPAAILSIFSGPRLAAGSWAHLIVDSCGWVLFLAGAAVRFWSTLYIGGRKRDTIVAEGPYSVCRNPLYGGSLLIALSAAFFLESVVLAAALLITQIAYLLTTVPQEEAGLERLHPTTFPEYCARVPRAWPKPSLWHTPARLDIDVAALGQEWARASRWIWLPIIARVIAHLRAETWWPHLVSRGW
jgi:protein-S-isoprenylcysteine O-methyltransferase Ste14